MMKRCIVVILAILLVSFTAYADSTTAAFPEDPVHDLIKIWNENGIRIKLPKRTPTIDNEAKERFLYRIGGNRDFAIIYDKYFDQSQLYLSIQTPRGYAPLRDMFSLTISYLLKMPEDSAYDLYDDLVHNMVDMKSEYIVGDSEISLMHFTSMGDMLSITIKASDLHLFESAPDRQAASVSADSNTRNAFEFMDLYTYYLQKISETIGIDATYRTTEFRVYDSIDQLDFCADQLKFFVNVPAGTLLVSVPDFHIVSAAITVQSLDNDSSDRNVDITRAAMAYAALEYEWFDDYLESVKYNLGISENKGAFDRAMIEFLENYNRCLSNPALFKKDGDPIPFASGNYNYFLKVVDSDDTAFILLSADEK